MNVLMMAAIWVAPVHVGKLVGDHSTYAVARVALRSLGTIDPRHVWFSRPVTGRTVPLIAAFLHYVTWIGDTPHEKSLFRYALVI
jgi:hypothetical protein